LIAFSHAVITSVKARFPARPALWLLDKLPADLPEKIEHLDGIDLRYSPRLTQSKIGSRATRDSLPQEARRGERSESNLKSKILYTFTVNEPLQIKHCRTLGFDAITTDFPARAKSLH
jgi:glycerophosphoryl diester phosphodiesterase